MDELEQLGVTSDDVVRYIWRVRQDPAQLRALASTLTSASGADHQRLVSDGSLLVRQFVRNRTAACNDGSPAGYFYISCVFFIQPEYSIKHKKSKT